MTGTLVRRLVRLEVAATAQREFRHLTMEQLQSRIDTLERKIAAADAGVANDRT